jgi:hypothetical protein
MRMRNNKDMRTWFPTGRAELARGARARSRVNDAVVSRVEVHNNKSYHERAQGQGQAEAAGPIFVQAKEASA